MATTHPIRSKEDIQLLAAHFFDSGEIRNHVLFVLAVNTALRICDILNLTWDDVYDFNNGRVRSSIYVIEEKTGKSKSIALNLSVCSALEHFATDAAVPGSCIFMNPKTGESISRTQAYRIIRAAGEKLNLDIRISCHSLRKTFGYHAFKNDVPLPVLMEIFNHSSLATTLRYLGVTQDEKDAAYLGINLIEQFGYAPDS